MRRRLCRRGDINGHCPVVLASTHRDYRWVSTFFFVLLAIHYFYMLDVITRQYSDTPQPFPHISIVLIFISFLVLILVLVFFSSFLPFLGLYYNN